MQVGPVRRDLQPPGLGGDHGVFVGLRGRQGAGGSSSTKSLSNTISI
jgi:hypothetical protein